MSESKSIKNYRSNFEKIKELVADAETDADKFYGDKNKSAGTRLRLKLAAIGKLCKEARKDVTDCKNEL